MADLLPDWASGILDAINTDTGFDLTGLANSFLGGGAAAQPKGLPVASGSPSIPPLFGPGGIIVNTASGSPSAPVSNAGVPAVPGQQGVMSYHVLAEKVKNKLGFKPRRKTILFIIRTLGFVTASSILGLDVSDVLWLFMHKRHSSRRHFVQTMVKAIKRGERYRHTLSKYKIPHARRSSSSNFGQRMAAARRRKKAA